MAYVKAHTSAKGFREKVGQMPDFSGAKTVPQEVPIGSRDGKNKRFVLRNKIVRYSESVYKDGLRMRRSESSSFTDGDYSIDYRTNEIIFSESQTPQPSGVLFVDYRSSE